MRLILASSSPRRVQLLTRAGFVFEQKSADIDETPLQNESPEACAKRLAIAKAQAVAQKLGGDQAIVLAADTIVALEQKILGKPIDPADAEKMLAELSGKTHRVITGYAITDEAGQVIEADIDTTSVSFRNITSAEIAAYVATGEPMDKSGSYAIQGGAAPFVAAQSGLVSTVVGLPVEILTQKIAKLLAKTS